jgi:hypothetical protein
LWVAAVLAVALSLYGIGNPDIAPNNARASIAQFVVILLALVYQVKGPKAFSRAEEHLEEEVRRASGYDDADQWSEAKEIATSALNDYTKYWQAILLSWCLLYFCFFLMYYFQLYPERIGQPESPLLGIYGLSLCCTLFTNSNSLIIALSYVILNKPTVGKDADRSISEIPLLPGLAIVMTVTLIEGTLLFSYPKEDSVTILTAFDWASGMAAGIMMALYVGRMQSKFLGPSPILLFFLYSYIAIQPLYIYVAHFYKGWTVLILDAALILKCLLCLYMIKLFRSGRLLFYFVRVRRTYQTVEHDWAHFRKILR